MPWASETVQHVFMGVIKPVIHTQKLRIIMYMHVHVHTCICVFDRASNTWHADQSLSLRVDLNRVKGQVVCGTVQWDMHFKVLLGSITRVEYCIPAPNFYLVLHGLCCRQSTLVNYSKDNLPIPKCHHPSFWLFHDNVKW